MAEAFIGMLVEVTLKHPDLTVILGRVASVDGTFLKLVDVFFPKIQQTAPNYSIASADIADLQIVETRPVHTTLPSPAHRPVNPAPALIPQFATSLDPAILSYKRPQAAAASAHRYPSAETIRHMQHSPVELSDAPFSAHPTNKPGHLTFGGTTLPDRTLKESSSTSKLNVAAQQPVKKAKRPKKKSQLISELQADQDGWASEDANGIQHLPEFDFAANLDKFDKRSVFDQIRNEDTTADEDRLVSHNRLPRARPGTYGGKNLHPTENVLGPALDPDQPHDRDVEQSETQSDSDSRPAPAGVPTIVSAPLTTRHHTARITHPATRDVSSRTSHRSTSSRPANASSSILKPVPDSQHQFLSQSSGLPCPSLDPHFLRQGLFDHSDHRVGLDTVVELAARNIAQTMTHLAQRHPAPSRRSSRTSLHHANGAKSSNQPVMVVLVGNHLKGAQTVAAVRHLYSRGFRILLSVPESKDSQSHHTQLTTQLSALRALGKKAARIDGWHGISAQVKRLHSPPSVIVDALLDGSCYSSIRDSSFALEVRETIDWVNRSRASVLSIECPSGYDATTAQTTTLEGEPLAVIPDRVLALGAPVVGLLEAAKDSESWTQHITVVDVGLQPALGPERLVPFGPDEWSLDLQFSGLVDA